MEFLNCCKKRVNSHQIKEALLIRENNRGFTAVQNLQISRGITPYEKFQPNFVVRNMVQIKIKVT